MVMVVECGSCHSRFRVNKSLLYGAFAIRFRCRTCAGFIVVRNPEMGKIATVPFPPPSPPPVFKEVPVLSAAHPIPEEPAVSSAIAPAVAGGEPEASVAGDKPYPPGAAASTLFRLQDLVPFEPEGEVRSGRDIAAGTGAVKRAATKTRPPAFQKRAWATGIFPVFAGLGILLLAIGAHYIGAFDPWGKPPAEPVFEVRDLNAYILKEAVAGNLFVITGTVKNVGNVSSPGIRIQATLFGKGNHVLIRQATVAGNYIDNAALPHMMRDAIEMHLALARYEAGTGNHEIHPGNSLPFIVVCFDPPGVVDHYEVHPANAEL